MQVLGIMGALSSGKTTVAQHLVQNHGWTRIRMAETLKAMLRTMGLSGEELDGDLKSWPAELLGGATPRLAMQTIGTEWRDMICHDLWVRTQRPRIAALVKNDPNVKIVIDDIRFPWEVDMVKDYGGQIWTIRRLSVEPVEPDWLERIAHFLRIAHYPKLHASETYWREFEDEADAVLYNTGTEDELRDEVNIVRAARL